MITFFKKKRTFLFKGLVNLYVIMIAILSEDSCAVFTKHERQGWLDKDFLTTKRAVTKFKLNSQPH